MEQEPIQIVDGDPHEPQSVDFAMLFNDTFDQLTKLDEKYPLTPRFPRFHYERRKASEQLRTEIKTLIENAQKNPPDDLTVTTIPIFRNLSGNVYESKILDIHSPNWQMLVETTPDKGNDPLESVEFVYTQPNPDQPIPNYYHAQFQGDSITQISRGITDGGAVVLGQDPIQTTDTLVLQLVS